ncbi:hypothetical protein BDZ89DRAFT_1059928 [Hymenopellis radicata]|nr:hypothetical protein BDZ89DRAFT_1059928 [Hymenopellis radicata]
MSSTSVQTEFLDRLSHNLRLIGALSFDEFVALPARPVPDVPEPSYAILQFSSSEQNVQPTTVSHKDSLGKLCEACQTAFPGTANVLKFSYTAEGNQCILTITRPNGLTRTYKSDATFSSKKEAKEQVCDRAIAFHADKFILQGDTKLHNVAALDGEDQSIQYSEPKSHSVQEVETICANSNLHMKWYTFNSNKEPSQKLGAALRVSWSPSAFKDYSCFPNFDTVEQAKTECAQNALMGGLRDLEKAPKNYKHTEHQTNAITLQAYFDSLPRPFPEPECEKPLASDVEITGWMNTLIQGAKGTFVRASFLPFIENGLPGCVLVVFRQGGESRTYIAEGRFSKRVDAKCAVIFLAMSSGVGQWIRDLKKAAAELVTPDMRKRGQSIAQTLDAGCKQLSGRIPSLNIVQDQDAFSATLSVHLSSEDVRTYTVPSEYRSKGDAKMAVYCEVAKDDTLDIIARRTGKKRKGLPEKEAGSCGAVVLALAAPSTAVWRVLSAWPYPPPYAPYNVPPHQNPYMGLPYPPPPHPYMYPPPHPYHGPGGYH